MKGAFENVRRTFAQMPADGQVRFEPGAEVLPGIRSVAAFGHTPGHMLVRLQSAHTAAVARNGSLRTFHRGHR